jgi:hypothetical protein
LAASDLNPSNKDALFDTWDEDGKDYAKDVMEKVVSIRTSLGVLYPLPILTFMPKFDKYWATAVLSEGNIAVRPEFHPPLGNDLPPPTLFGDERINEARRRRAARDSLQVLDPRAELNQYLREPLVAATCPVPIWWKVCSAIINLL